MDVHFITPQFYGDIGVVQEIMHEILLDQIAFIAQADDKLIEPIMTIDLHDMP
jgi:hypothetical protein